MPKRVIIAVTGLFFLAVSSLVLADETLTVTAYYPSPYGSFNQLTTTGATYLAITSGNVGIGTTNPGEKLEINGNLKFTGDTNVMSRAPRVIHTTDSVAGCPPVRAANTDLFTQTFTLTRSAFVYSDANVIRLYAGRADMMLYIDGVWRDQTLDYTPSSQWWDDNVHWAGTLAAGNHTVSVRGNIANIWGCGTSWGSIDTIILES